MYFKAAVARLYQRFQKKVIKACVGRKVCSKSDISEVAASRNDYMISVLFTSQKFSCPWGCLVLDVFKVRDSFVCSLYSQFMLLEFFLFSLFKFL